jgi:glycopeptide antibiotics resistance protein
MINQIIKSILFLSAITLPFWIAIRLAINISRRRRRQPTSIIREILLTSFFLYLVFLAAVTIVPLPISRFRKPGYEYINLLPVLHSLKCLLQKQAERQESVMFCLENTFGNIVLFLPLGAALPLISDKFGSIQRVILAAFLLSFGIEAIQFLSRYFGSFRSVDIDDVLLNTFGACVGYVCFAVLRRQARAGALRKV